MLQNKRIIIFFFLQQSDKNIYQLQLGSLLFHKNTQTIFKNEEGGRKHLDLLELLPWLQGVQGVNVDMVGRDV